MKLEDLIKNYEAKKTQYGTQAYRYISDVLREAKELHKESFIGEDRGQSWRSSKGKNLEKLIEYLIKDEIRHLGLEIINGNKLEKTKPDNLSKELSYVKRNLLIDYGEFGYHLPDVDIVIYIPNTNKIIAVLSVKVTLRERIAQTGYWKLKFDSDEATKHIKVYFLTLDEDETLNIRKPAKKGRAIVEKDTDGSYVLSTSNIEESDKVKTFDKFISDIEALLK